MCDGLVHVTKTMRVRSTRTATRSKRNKKTTCSAGRTDGRDSSRWQIPLKKKKRLIRQTRVFAKLTEKFKTNSGWASVFILTNAKNKSACETRCPRRPRRRYNDAKISFSPNAGGLRHRVLCKCLNLNPNELGAIGHE